MRGWTVRDCMELYNVPRGAPGSSRSTRRGTSRCNRIRNGPSIDLLDLVQDLQQRGLRTPLLMRFSDILAARVQGLCAAFERAIEEYGYQGAYRGVYPIKVNQQRHVVEEIVEYGAQTGVGLEAGSKPELLIALALLETPGALIICNGYKDRKYIETALLGQRLGRTPIIVVDRFHEVELIIRTSQELGIRPHIGVRARLSTKGAGKWIESTGDRSKFGLTAVEIVDVVDRLRAEDMLDCLRAAALPHRLADHRHPRPQGRAARGRPHLRRPARDGRQAAPTSTSAAASASTTTARRPTSTRR